jgi:hypothetical protein
MWSAGLVPQASPVHIAFLTEEPMFSRNSRAWTTTAALALVGAVAVLGTAGHAEASAAVQRASAQPASAFDPMIVHLHGNYETALSHPETVHMAGVDYANGKQPKAPAGAVRAPARSASTARARTAGTAPTTRTRSARQACRSSRCRT